MSVFRVCIVRPDGSPVLLYPGSQGERDLVTALTATITANLHLTDTLPDSILEKGVGLFHTEAQVRRAIETALTELAPRLTIGITSSIQDVLHALKAEVQPS